MDAVFQKFRKREGRIGPGRWLGMNLTGGRFWPRFDNCHTVYRGQDGNMDYYDVQAVMENGDSQVSIINQDLPVNTIWHFTRREVSDCGKESPAATPACVVRIGSDGEAIAAAPNAPQLLTGKATAGGKIELKWYYSTLNQPADCDGFRIYIDSGSGFDFDTPDATKTPGLSLTRTIAGEEFTWESDALNDGQQYNFCVRSFKTSGGESQNEDYITVTADAQGPAAITDLRSNVQEF